jgi:class 3 adenylate cyclase
LDRCAAPSGLVDRRARAAPTLLFTDIVESTQAIVDLGDEQWRDVLDDTLAHAICSRHRGREVNTRAMPSSPSSTGR